MPVEIRELQISSHLTAGFRFVVSIADTAVAAFTECTLPTMEIEVEEIKEGGLNTFVHQLPKARKSARISLRNGVAVIQDLHRWYIRTMNGEIVRKRISVSVLSTTLEPIMTLDIEDAYPVKWSGPELKADNNTVAIQTLEFACGEVSVRE
jgi:phage tail-like protein